MEFVDLLNLLPESETRERAKTAVLAEDSEAFVTALEELAATQELPELLAQAIINSTLINFAAVETNEEAFKALAVLRDRVDLKYHYILDELKAFFELPDDADVTSIPDIDDLLEAYPEELRIYNLASYLAKSLECK